jgi:xanthine/uracil permease
MEFRPSASVSLKWLKRFGPILVGASVGYAYYYFIGCVSGSCPITSNPWSSIVYGAILGALVGSWRFSAAAKD